MCRGSYRLLLISENVRRWRSSGVYAEAARNRETSLRLMPYESLRFGILQACAPSISGNERRAESGRVLAVSVTRLTP